MYNAGVEGIVERKFAMKALKLVIPLLGIMLASGTGSAIAASQAVKDLAAVVSDLNHQPTAADKAKLNKIAADPSASTRERLLAEALLNMNHKVSDAYKARLKELANNSAASAEERELAAILVNFAHQPSAEDQAKLKSLSQ